MENKVIYGNLRIMMKECIGTDENSGKQYL